jgi:hypothetical protein
LVLTKFAENEPQHHPEVNLDPARQPPTTRMLVVDTNSLEGEYLFPTINSKPRSPVNSKVYLQPKKIKPLFLYKQNPASSSSTCNQGLTSTKFLIKFCYD